MHKGVRLVHVPGQVLGIRELQLDRHELRFTPAALAILQEAGKLAEAARYLIRDTGDAYDQDVDMELADIEHACKAIVDAQGVVRVELDPFRDKTPASL